MRQTFEATKIFHLSLDEPLPSLEVESRYREVLLIVMTGGQIVGEIYLPALDVVPAELVREVVATQVGEELWQRRLAESVVRAATGSLPGASGGAPSASVVVCTRNRPDALRSCLDSLLALETAPTEIIVVDNCPDDDRTRDLCRRLPVRYVRENAPGTARARNRGVVEATGELIAFTDDDCIVDSRWLNGLGTTFADPLVMAATGYIGPLELETRAQYLFEAHGGFEKRFRDMVLDGVIVSPVVVSGLGGATANLIVRRRAFELVGLFAEDLGPGTPARGAEDAYQHYRILAAGYRIAVDPTRIVWHRHRSDEAALRQVLSDYSLSAFAYTTRCLVKHRELGVLHVWSWWLRHLLGDLRRTTFGRDGAIPLRVVLAEIGGSFRGPWRLSRSIWSRRRIPPLELPPRTPGPAARRIQVGAADPSLSVVLASRNRRDKLAKVLAALGRQTYPADRFETIVVLDGSTDGSGEMVRSLATSFGLRLLEHENRGLAASRNRGAREAREAILVFIDDDTIPEPGWLAAHAGAHREAPREHLGLGYYPPVVEDGSLWGLVVRAWWEDHFRRKTEPNHRWTYIDFAGGNSSFPASLFHSFGGFDEDFRGRREDWELAVRLLGRGVPFAYYPGAKALHYLDTSLATGLRHERQQARDDVLLATKHPQMKGQLPLAGFAHSFSTGSERLARIGATRARMLEGLRLRRRWRMLVDRLVVNSYALGLEDVFPSREEFLAFMASTWEEPVETTQVRLDSSIPLRLPAGTDPVELSVEYDGASLGRLVPLDPGSQWEWDVVAQRVVRHLGENARRAMLTDELTRRTHRTERAALAEASPP